MAMNNPHLLLRSNLKQLRLPAMQAEFEKLAREAAAANEGHEQYLLRLTELKPLRGAATRFRHVSGAAGVSCAAKDFDTFDFTTLPHLNKQKVLELARGEWIEQHANVCFIGSPGDRQDTSGDRPGSGQRLPAGQAGAVLHRRGHW